MPRRVVLIQGHPDPAGGHYCHALADAYAAGAKAAGHEVRRIAAAGLDVGFVRNQADWKQPAPDAVKPAQAAVAWADHLVFVYPLWMGTMPAVLKSFLEHLSRAGFAIEVSADGKTWTRKFKGKSARIVVTMGMPALVYRWYFGAHSLKNLEQNILRFSGAGPVRSTLIGMVDAIGGEGREAWLGRMEALGRKAS